MSYRRCVPFTEGQIVYFLGQPYRVVKSGEITTQTVTADDAQVDVGFFTEQLSEEP